MDEALQGAVGGQSPVGAKDFGHGLGRFLVANRNKRWRYGQEFVRFGAAQARRSTRARAGSPVEAGRRVALEAVRRRQDSPRLVLRRQSP